MITRPLLAATLDNVEALNFPVLATPKLDGIRVLKVGGKVVTRTFKPIPNHHIRGLLEKHLPDGVDGELMTPGTFNDIQSKVMSFDGEPRFTFYAFDYVKDSLDKAYQKRVQDMQAVLERLDTPFRIVILVPKMIWDMKELLEYEERCLDKGFEGIMLRNPLGKYKCGRSTLKDGILLKLKRFQDAEAKVVGFEEKLHNMNKVEQDQFGLTKRSSKKGGLVKSGVLGALIVEDVKTGIRFNIGSGFDDDLKLKIWKNRKRYLNKLVKYKYQSIGKKEAPRFPVFLGFRSKLDV